MDFKLVRINDAPAIMSLPAQHLDEETLEVVTDKEWDLDIIMVNPTLAKQPKFKDGVYVFILSNNTATDAIIRKGESLTRFVGANSDAYDPNRFTANDVDEFKTAVGSFFPCEGGATMPLIAAALNDRVYGADKFMRFMTDRNAVDSIEFAQEHVNDTVDGANKGLATMLYGMYEDGGVSED